MKRSRKTSGTKVAVIATIGIGILGVSVPAAAVATDATPTVTGCPAAYQALTLTYLAQQSPNYHLPALLDDPANGGNGDGIVCGKPLSPLRQAHICGGPCDVPLLYAFSDNSLTPAH